VEYQKALGYQQISSLNTAQALTVPKGTHRALVQAESQSVRWRDDGTAPTASVGNILSVGDTLEYDATALEVVKFIEITASAKLNVHYYGT
jgi:hypothetical protein